MIKKCMFSLTWAIIYPQARVSQGFGAVDFIAGPGSETLVGSVWKEKVWSNTSQNHYVLMHMTGCMGKRVFCDMRGNFEKCTFWIFFFFSG